MPHKQGKGNVRSPMRDNSRNISVRMTEDQYQRLRRYMGLTHLTSTAYLCRLIRGDTFKSCPPKLRRAMHASVNRIYSNVRQIARHQRARTMDEEAVSRRFFLADKLCGEIFLLSNLK